MMVIYTPQDAGDFDTKNILTKHGININTYWIYGRHGIYEVLDALPKMVMILKHKEMTLEEFLKKWPLNVVFMPDDLGHAQLERNKDLNQLLEAVASEAWDHGRETGWHEGAGNFSPDRVYKEKQQFLKKYDNKR